MTSELTLQALVDIGCRLSVEHSQAYGWELSVTHGRVHFGAKGASLEEALQNLEKAINETAEAIIAAFGKKP
jgi:bifunctional pyridoxal-dependent enzyme with beta-cystathionase and maltose regulon repressor activities